MCKASSPDFSCTCRITASKDSKDVEHVLNDRLIWCCCRDNGGPNLGLTFFRSKKRVLKLVVKWLALIGPDVWDQNMFRQALEECADADQDLQIQVAHP